MGIEFALRGTDEMGQVVVGFHWLRLLCAENAKLCAKGGEVFLNRSLLLPRSQKRDLGHPRVVGRSVNPMSQKRDMGLPPENGRLRT